MPSTFRPLDAATSQRLAVLRFPLIVGVVFVHAYETAVHLTGQTIGSTQNSAIVDFVRNVISQGLARTAVPLFFLMSGYLLFLHFSWSKQAYGKKLVSRIPTLLVPFLIWNIAGLLVTAAAQAYPPTAQYFSGRTTNVASLTPYGYADALLGLQRMPIAYQFWFIRDLMLLVLLSPLTYLLATRLPRLSVAVLLACWAAGAWPVPLLSVEATLFFFIGNALALHKLTPFVLDRWATALLPAYLAILVADALLFTQPFHPYLQRAGIAAGVIVVLAATALVLRAPALKERLISLGAASFFVFAAHEPLLTLCRKLIYKVSGAQSATAVLTLYFAIPIGLIAVLVLLYRVLARYLPAFTQLINGGRRGDATPAARGIAHPSHSA